MNLFHKFEGTIPATPRRMNSPFSADVPEVARLAASEAMAYINSIPQLSQALQQGKMLGVLVVKKADEYGFFAAYSGFLPAECAGTDYFVPPVYDLRSANSYFPAEEAKIVAVNTEIAYMQSAPKLIQAERALAECRMRNEQEISTFRNRMRENKIQRECVRKSGADDSTIASLVVESQYEKAELVRLKRRCKDEEKQYVEVIEKHKKEITALMEKREAMSRTLQSRIFDSFRFVNGNGQATSLVDIFSAQACKIPPAGAGECAAPRLLQYALKNGYFPVAIGEFWYGDSPQSEVRRHGCFYEACVAKCHPILGYMLEGVEVDSVEASSTFGADDIPVLYEDDSVLVVNKPSGLPSVPGKASMTSVISLLSAARDTSELYAVHRLDMDTSGVLVLAKNLGSYTTLQRQFASREVKKYYYAVVDSASIPDIGEITLALRSDYEHRPRQVVDIDHGKPAYTIFETLNRNEQYDISLVRFSPVTGRTHQLRVHASHPAGLCAPILGDKLYGGTNGKSVPRLMLHAAEILFRHPESGTPMEIKTDLPKDFYSLLNSK